MYLINKCAKYEQEIKQQGQVLCVTHLHALAVAVYYVSQPFLLKKMRPFSKYVQVLFFDGTEASVIAEITPDAIIDSKGNAFKFRVHGEAFIENFIIHENGEKQLKSVYKTTFCTNAVKLISTAIHYQNRLLNTSQSKWRKQTYYYCGGRLKYIFNRNGIYDKNMKMVCDFNVFFVPKFIPKRLR